MNVFPPGNYSFYFRFKTSSRRLSFDLARPDDVAEGMNEIETGSDVSRLPDDFGSSLAKGIRNVLLFTSATLLMSNNFNDKTNIIKTKMPLFD